MLTVLLRATILFLSAVFVVRVMGKRQVGQLQPYELVIAIMIAELAATPMEDIGVPLIYGIVPMLTLMVLHSAFSIASVKSQRAREFLNGTPSVLIRRGVIQKDELLRSCYNLNDLLEEMRAAGILNPAEVGTAILETSGKIERVPQKRLPRRHARRPESRDRIRGHSAHARAGRGDRALQPEKGRTGRKLAAQGAGGTGGFPSRRRCCWRAWIRRACSLCRARGKATAENRTGACA